MPKDIIYLNEAQNTEPEGITLKEWVESHFLEIKNFADFYRTKNQCTFIAKKDSHHEWDEEFLKWIQTQQQ